MFSMKATKFNTDVSDASHEYCLIGIIVVKAVQTISIISDN